MRPGAARVAACFLLATSLLACPVPPVVPVAREGAKRVAPAPDDSITYVLHAADVGTGLALYLEGPGVALVYDGGSNDDRAGASDNRFLRYLQDVGAARSGLDHVILSHAHRDHVELLADVVAAYPPRELWEPGVRVPLCAYRRFLEAAATARTLYHDAQRGPGDEVLELPSSNCGAETAITLRHGARLYEGLEVPLGVYGSMRFLHVEGRPHRDANANSLVVRLSLAGSTVLLMGDAEAGGRADPSEPPEPHSVEGQLLARHRAELDADVLVVAHHGSKTSSRKAFLEAVTPKLSVLSSGPMHYGSVQLPDREVLSALAAYGPVFRTDRDDARCATNADKIGPDDDGRPGGCDNIQVVIHSHGAVAGSYFSRGDTPHTP